MGEICGIFNYSSHYPRDNRQDDKQERLKKEHLSS